MGIEALTRTSDGGTLRPATRDEWNDWLSATRTRNHVLGDPILDWLNLYAKEKGFPEDTDLLGYDPRADFTTFIFQQGHLFEAAVVRHLRTLTTVVAVSEGLPEEIRDLAKAEETFAAMQRGEPIIHQGVLRDADSRTYGAPDLLVRSDELARLFPDALTQEEAAVPAPDLGDSPWHYRVVDVKFTTLHLMASGVIGNSGSAPAYKAQLFVYNRALGLLQGFEPPTSYLLGRGWVQGKDRGSGCMERLGPVHQAGTIAGDLLVSQAVAEAADWVRRVRAEGAGWSVLPEPSLPELWPDMGNSQDGPWHAAKARIAQELEDLTLLWQVGIPGRRRGHEAGVYRWTDPRVTPELMGITGATRPTILAQILEANKTPDGPAVRPPHIDAHREEWHAEPALEFYVDFETVSDLADDFSRIPERGGQPLIFMIGCGHMEDGQWAFASFVVDALSEPEEARIIDAWLDHMESVRRRMAPEGEVPRVVHWSPAEVTNFETAYNSAKDRQGRSDWPTPPWFDFLGKVIRKEPVVVRGALAFGLKAAAKAMHGHGLIQTLWGDGPADGLGAMAGAWWCQGEALRRGVPMPQIDLMQEIQAYNQVDCKVMMEIVAYLRAHH